MVTRRRMLQGVGALALLSPFGKDFGHAQAKDAAQVAQQEHAKPTGDGYVPVTDPLVKAKLAQWSDWKFGLILHWGIYSVLGIVESWTLCSEDWIRRPAGVGYVEWKRRYEQLRTRFNPVRFDPAQWAEAAHAAGMRYLVFTTKHHDGFCMFDTAQTAYRVTAPDVPYHATPRANIAKAVFDAFRRRGFGIGAYFSKADWHHPDYWSPLWATPDRNNNYDVRKYPEMWQRFVDFTSRVGSRCRHGHRRAHGLSPGRIASGNGLGRRLHQLGFSRCCSVRGNCSRVGRRGLCSWRRRRLSIADGHRLGSIMLGRADQMRQGFQHLELLNSQWTVGGD